MELPSLVTCRAADFQLARKGSIAAPAILLRS